MKKLFSIILPIYKNELNLPVTIPYIMEHLYLFPEYDVEIIMVNDGSPDNSYTLMKQYQKQYPDRIRIASFSKNYGQRAAINYGMKMAKGAVIGVISADLQDPFELFTDMLLKWETGIQLVFGTREARAEKGIGAMCSNLLHRMIQKHINPAYPRGGFDFFVADRELCKKFIECDTKNNSMQLLLLELAASHESIPYIRKQREQGKSSWKLSRKIDQVLNIFVTYSDYPIRVSIGLGLTFLCLGFLGVLTGIVLTFFIKWGVTVFILLLSAQFSFNGIVLLSIGMTGEYLYKNMESNRKMPRYVVQEVIENEKDGMEV